jgi:AraC family transcriptional regulator
MQNPANLLQGEGHSRSALSAQKLRLVIEYIESHLDRNVRLAELAALVDLTPRYFCAVFKRAIGRPPHQFQIEQRIERAKSLLRQPPVSLTDVALMVGFSSQSHLNAYFRRIVGVTPARYRAAILQNKPH